MIKRHCFINNGERVTREDVERKSADLRLAIKHAVQHWCNDHTECGEECIPPDGRQRWETGLPGGYLEGHLVATQLTEGANFRQLSGTRHLFVEGGKTLTELLISYLDSVFTLPMCKKLLQPGFGSNDDDGPPSLSVTFPFFSFFYSLFFSPPLSSTNGSRTQSRKAAIRRGSVKRGQPSQNTAATPRPLHFASAHAPPKNRSKITLKQAPRLTCLPLLWTFMPYLAASWITILISHCIDAEWWPQTIN